MNPMIAARMKAVQMPVIPVVGDLIRRHPGTISLGQGVVHFGPPPEAMRRVAQFGGQAVDHKYHPVDGTPALREALTAKLRSENGIEVGQARRIVVTAGGNMGFMNAVLAIADPGDEIILPTPYYFNHEMAIVMANCRPVLVPTDENYQLDLTALTGAITPHTRAIVTISPNNPTGAVYPESALRAVNELCRKRGLFHISDEAYEYFVYNGTRHFSPAGFSGSEAHTISLFSMSKAYGMASWRIGWMVVPESLFEPIRKVQDTILICPPVISQEAAVGALAAGLPYCQPFLKELAGVRQHVLEQLDSLRSFCTVPRADGAFYFLLRLDTKLEPMAVVERLVRDFGVAVIPGTTFGATDGCRLRIAYGALDAKTVREGIGRLVRGLRAVGGLV